MHVSAATQFSNKSQTPQRRARAEGILVPSSQPGVCLTRGGPVTGS